MQINRWKSVLKLLRCLKKYLLKNQQQKQIYMLHSGTGKYKKEQVLMLHLCKQQILWLRNVLIQNLAP